MNILCYVQKTKKYLSHYQFLINLEELVKILKQKVLNYYNLSDLYLFIYCSKNVIKNWLGHFLFIYLFVYRLNILYSIFQANQMQFKVQK